MEKTTPEGDTILGHAWCAECRRRQPIIDRHPESNYQGGSAMAREHHYLVEDLDCGHEVVHAGPVTNTAPGGGSGELPRAHTMPDPWAEAEL